MKNSEIIPLTAKKRTVAVVPNKEHTRDQWKEDRGGHCGASFPQRQAQSSPLGDEAEDDEDAVPDQDLRGEVKEARPILEC
jgi:hypothetical protein